MNLNQLVVSLPFIAYVAFWTLTGFIQNVDRLKGVGEGFLSSIFNPIFLFILFYVSEFSFSNTALIGQSLASEGAGFVVELLGLLLLMWARLVLGKNWTSAWKSKEAGKLVTGGPYALVRHPIYPGTIVLFAGVFVFFGQVVYLLGVLVIFLFSLVRSKSEEKELLEHFPKEYSEYRKQVKAFFPLVY